MKTITAGMPAQVEYVLYDFDGTALEDTDVSALTYSVYDVTNSTVVRAATAIAANASGTIGLDAADTQINGPGSREKRRLCLDVNAGEFWSGDVFYVASSSCEA